MQRQRLPSMWSTISCLVGSGFLESSDAACMICPDWQYPHCGTCSTTHATCSGWLPPRPSMVVTFLPAASLAEVWQERTATPSTCTVQAPHRPAPQPNLVPVICRCSRMTQSNGVSLSTSTCLAWPLTVSAIMLCFLRGLTLGVAKSQRAHLFGCELSYF